MALPVVKEVSIAQATEVNNTIPEFEQHIPDYFENRYKGKEHLVLVSYIDQKPAGYMICYDRYADGSIYCWMAGVNPKFRGCGVLKELMSYLETWAKKNGYIMVKIKTRNSRREMLTYLSKYGYYFVKVLTRDDIQNNRILLQKPL